MIVIADASPLLALAQADALHVLQALFGRVLVPEAVRRETVDNCPVLDQRRRIEGALDNYLLVRTPQGDYPFSRNLGAGEREVLALALDQRADLLLMDDRKARNEAAAHSLTCAYTTDVLRLAEQRRIIPSAAEVVSGLREAGIFLPQPAAVRH